MSNDSVIITLAVAPDSPLGAAILEEHRDTGEVQAELRSADDFVMGETLVTDVGVASANGENEEVRE